MPFIDLRVLEETSIFNYIDLHCFHDSLKKPQFIGIEWLIVRIFLLPIEYFIFYFIFSF